MKRVHYFVYGLLAGAVLVLSSIILVQSVDSNKARAQTAASNSSEIAMVAAQYQQSEHILYVATKNPEGEPVLMSYTTLSLGNFGLLSARNLKYDRRMNDILLGRPKAQGTGKTSPPFVELKRQYERTQGKGKTK